MDSVGQIVARAALCLATIIVGGFAFGLQEAGAISTYNPTTMACGAVKSTVRSKGAVMLRWRSPRTGNPLYGRYVANRRYCDVHEVTTIKSVPTSNKQNCPVFKCIPRSYVVDDDWCLFGPCRK